MVSERVNALLEENRDIPEGSRRINLLLLWIHEFSISVEILPLLDPLLESLGDDKERARGDRAFSVESRK